MSKLNLSQSLQMCGEMHNGGYREPVCLLILIQQLEGNKTRKSGFTWLFSNKQISSVFQAERRGNSASENEHLSEPSSKFFACASLYMNCDQYLDLVLC